MTMTHTTTTTTATPTPMGSLSSLLLRLSVLCGVALLLLQVVKAEEAPVCNGLCSDGSTIGNPTKIIPQFELPGGGHSDNPTCQFAAEYAQATSSLEICQLLQSQAAYFCGCPNDAPSSSSNFNPCQLCGDGSAPANSDWKLPYGNDLVTCNDLYEYLQYLPQDACQNTESGQDLLRNAFYCGCTTASPEEVCIMCPDGTIDLQYPDRIIPFFNLDAGQASPTCWQVASTAAVTNPDRLDCSLVQAQAGYCGCQNVQPVNACSFCPNGETPANMDLVTPSTDTCQDLYTYAQYVTADDCTSKRFKSMQGLAFECGCPNVEPACTLCEDGSDPPNPDWLALPTGETCSDMQSLINSYTQSACADFDTTVFITAARCQCPNAFVPVCQVQQSPHLCTQELLDKIPESELTWTGDGSAGCECAAFCDGEFFTCNDFPGGLLNAQLCSGVQVSGCNAALIEAQQKANIKTSTSSFPSSSASALTTTTTTTPWLFLVMVFVSVSTLVYPKV